MNINTTQSQNTLLPGDFTVKPQNLAQAAEQFEALFLQTLLRQMRKAAEALSDGTMFDSQQQRMIRDLYDDKLALQLASQRSTGIAQLMIAQLSPQFGKAVNQ